MAAELYAFLILHIFWQGSPCTVGLKLSSLQLQLDTTLKTGRLVEI